MVPSSPGPNVNRDRKAPPPLRPDCVQGQQEHGSVQGLCQLRRLQRGVQAAQGLPNDKNSCQQIISKFVYCTIRKLNYCTICKFNYCTVGIPFFLPSVQYPPNNVRKTREEAA